MCKPLRVSTLNMSKYQALFFDFDGVLADSVMVKTKAFRALYEPYGPEIQAKVVEHHLLNGGMSRFEKFRHYSQEFCGQPLSENTARELCKRFALLVVDAVTTAPEIAGALAFVQAQSKEKPCFIVSGTPELELIQIVSNRGLTPYFKEVLGSPVGKTDNTSKLLEKYKLSPGCCLFLGDSTSDYRAAQRTGTDFLGVLPDCYAPLLCTYPKIKWITDFL